MMLKIAKTVFFCIVAALLGLNYGLEIAGGLWMMIQGITVWVREVGFYDGLTAVLCIAAVVGVLTILVKRANKAQRNTMEE